MFSWAYLKQINNYTLTVLFEGDNSEEESVYSSNR